MKTGKDGKIKLEKDEMRIGNFVFKTEERHVKICDINSTFTHRVSVDTAIGRLLGMAIKAGNESFLHGYAALMFNVSCVVPDEEFFKGVNRECIGCANRHKSLYGIKEDISGKEDARILEEERTMHEVVERLKNEGNDTDSKD